MIRAIRLTFTKIACAYALALLRRRAWPAADLRVANLRLAIALCGLALLLSTPLIAFGRLSAGDQLHRLTSGAVPLAQFDWTAIRLDFGPDGIAVLRRLARQSPLPVIRTTAATALRRTYRWQFEPSLDAIEPGRPTVLPGGTATRQSARPAMPAQNAALTQGAVEIRTVTRRQIFVAGQPLGRPFR